jgi:tRNA(Ile)-lysidine synthase
VPGANSPIAPAEFAAALARLGPFEPQPRLAVAVSGGADSLALALLADRWARGEGGSVLALIVDHTLRDSSTAEAALTAVRLAAHGIQPRVLTLTDLPYGTALAERARNARYHALTRACIGEGILHLLLGHHRSDQAETLLIRSLGGSAAPGLAAMAPLVETVDLRLLRPLLDFPPARLRAHLRAAGIGWVEDPSNQDLQALRPRLRAQLQDKDGTGSATRSLAEAAASHGAARAAREQVRAAEMAQTVTLRPEGFAVLPRAPIAPDILAALIQAISGARYPADTASVTLLAAAPRPATLAGARLIEAMWAADGQKKRPSLMLLREEAAIGPAVAAQPGAVWDGRFRVRAPQNLPDGLFVAKLGDAAAVFRRRSSLPAALLRTLPALWSRAASEAEKSPENRPTREKLVAVPHLGYHHAQMSAAIELTFAPTRPAAPSAFAVSGGM